jgi:hypothetical protein
MTTEEAAALELLLAAQETAPRGPKREGVFALWLVARVALDIGTSAAPLDRSERRRLALLAKRLAPLAVPRPLARGLAAALGHLDEGTPRGARIALSQLVAPSHEALGSDIGEALAVLARHLHTPHHGGTP